METTMNAEHLPKTDSIEELAQFWDTHDLTDFEEELEEVSGPIFNQNRPITIQLTPIEAQAVRQMANAKGMVEAELIRNWVLEKLHSP
jgi:predicted DNA binding CopG/RHH family protein